MLCAFSMVRIVVVPLVAPGVTGTVAATFPSTRTWMLAMAAVGLPGRDQVTGKLAGTAVPVAGAVRVAAFGPGAAGAAAGATNDTGVTRVVLPAASLALIATVCEVPAVSAGRVNVVADGSVRPTSLLSRVTVYTATPVPVSTDGVHISRLVADGATNPGLVGATVSAAVGTARMCATLPTLVTWIATPAPGTCHTPISGAPHVVLVGDGCMLSSWVVGAPAMTRWRTCTPARG